MAPSQGMAPHALVPKKGKLTFPLPLPKSLRCGVRGCIGLSGSGPWSGPDRHKKALSHANNHHQTRGGTLLLECHLCICGREFGSLTTGGRHLRSRVDPCKGSCEDAGESNSTVASELGSISGTARRSLSLDLAVPKFDGKVLVLGYPGQPSRCPLWEEGCPFITRTSGCVVGNSMERHLEMEHGTMKKEDKPIRRWECPKCGLIDTGHVLKNHANKCPKARVSLLGGDSQSRAVLAPATPTQQSNNTFGLGGQVATIPETQLNCTPHTLPSPILPSQGTMVPATPTQESNDTFGLGGQITTMVPETQPTLYAPATPTQHSTVITERGGQGPRVIPETQFYQTEDSRQPSPQVPQLSGDTPNLSLASREEGVGMMVQISTPTAFLAPSLQNEIFPEYDSDSPDSPRPACSTPEVSVRPLAVRQGRLSALPPVHTESRAKEPVVASSPHAPDDEENQTSPAPTLDDDEESSCAGEFFRLWARIFEECQSAEHFNQILTNCTADWVLRSTNPREEEEGIPQMVRAGRGPDHRSPRARTQSRQQQRVRRERKFNANEASRIQKMFKIYPRRAVRRVLGETSSPYTGDAEAAASYLRHTYEQPEPLPEHLAASRKLYDECSWSTPSVDQLSFLDHPPSKVEIANRLRRAVNTAPGQDRLEYRHLRKLDPEGLLLERIYGAVWRFGIPDSWRTSRTVPFHKKGDTSDYSNFRPISLLPTIYKIFSSILSQRLTTIASELGWLSPEQKGFLPGVHGIAEHSGLLQTVVEVARAGRRQLSIGFLDLCNAFGSLPHAVLGELFASLPIPSDLRRLLLDIYSNNIMEFAVGAESVVIRPSTGVRQGDALSTTIFNLAAEPLLRAAKTRDFDGFTVFGQEVRVTAYADDLAVVSTSPSALQGVLGRLCQTAKALGLEFNPGKCAALLIKNAKAMAIEDLTISGGRIRCLSGDEQVEYLGVPLGAKLRFRPPSHLVGHLDKVATSLLSPCQKLEVLRCHLLPSLSHHLATGRVQKDELQHLDTECRKFMAHIADLPNHAIEEFFYSDRRVGGMGMFKLTDDADIWTLGRAAQLLTSKDLTVRSIFSEQMRNTIRIGLGAEPSYVLSSDTISAFLSGSSEEGMYRVRFSQRSFANLWTLARAAARRLVARVDVSGDEITRLVADDISVLPVKAIRGLRTVVRQRHTRKFLAASHQGKVANGLALDISSKDVARTLSCRTELGHEDWKLLHRARLDILPLRGYPWYANGDRSCRRCCQGSEDAFHVLNNCREGLVLATSRHDAVLGLLHQLLTRKGLTASINRAVPGQSLRPDVELQFAGARLMLDVVVSYDTPSNMEAAFRRKVDKYMTLGNILPLVVGSLGSWYPRNDEIRSLLNISGRSWCAFKRKARIAAIQGSMLMIRNHMAFAPADDRGPRQEDPVSEAGSILAFTTNLYSSH